MTIVSELLDLANHYYIVAADMERHARHQLEIAKQLNEHADRLCEQNIRRCSPNPTSEQEKP